MASTAIHLREQEMTMASIAGPSTIDNPTIA